MRWLKEPTPASARIATGGPPDAGLGDDVDDAADRVVAVEHRAAVAARDFDALDRIDAEWWRRSTPCMSMSLSRRPLISTRVLAVANAPNPAEVDRRSWRHSRRHKTTVSCTPGVCAMISCTVWAGECAMSSAVMTVVDAPTMPANCRFVVALPVDELPAGAPFGLLVCATVGAGRCGPDPSSVMGLARVRFASSGGLTSIGGS